jgi:hypothetical protein
MVKVDDPVTNAVPWRTKTYGGAAFHGIVRLLSAESVALALTVAPCAAYRYMLNGPPAVGCPKMLDAPSAVPVLVHVLKMKFAVALLGMPEKNIPMLIDVYPAAPTGITKIVTVLPMV